MEAVFDLKRKDLDEKKAQEKKYNHKTKAIHDALFIVFCSQEEQGEEKDHYQKKKSRSVREKSGPCGQKEKKKILEFQIPSDQRICCKEKIPIILKYVKNLENASGLTDMDKIRNCGRKRTNNKPKGTRGKLLAENIRPMIKIELRIKRIERRRRR